MINHKIDKNSHWLLVKLEILIYFYFTIVKFINFVIYSIMLFFHYKA